jgi:hypothetical protein
MQNALSVTKKVYFGQGKHSENPIYWPFPAGLHFGGPIIAIPYTVLVFMRCAELVARCDTGAITQPYTLHLTPYTLGVGTAVRGRAGLKALYILVE